MLDTCSIAILAQADQGTCVKASWKVGRHVVQAADGRRLQGSPPGSPGLHHREGAAERPAGRAPALRGHEHLRLPVP